MVESEGSWKRERERLQNQRMGKGSWYEGSGRNEEKKSRRKEGESFKLRKVVGLIEVKESLKMAKLQKQKKPQ